MTTLYKKVSGSWVEQTDWATIWEKISGSWNEKYVNKIDRVFATDDSNKQHIEINRDTRIEINRFNSPATTPQDIGGMKGRLFVCDNSPYVNYEIDFIGTALNSAVVAAVGSNLGMGGNADQMFNAHGQTGVDEINPDSFAVLSTAKPGSTTPRGVGGDETRVFHCDAVDDFIAELNVNTKLIIKNVASGPNPRGIGGDNTKLFYSQYGDGFINELNKDSLAIIATGTSDGNQYYGAGGVK